MYLVSSDKDKKKKVSEYCDTYFFELDADPPPLSLYSFFALSYCLLASPAFVSHSWIKKKKQGNVGEKWVGQMKWRLHTNTDKWVALLVLLLHLLLIFAQLPPHLSGLLGDFCDRDARILRLDALTARVQPEHVGAHWPLGTTGIFLLLLLRLKKRKEKQQVNVCSLYTLYSLFATVGTSLWKKNGFLSLVIFQPLHINNSVFSLSRLLSHLFAWFPFFLLLHHFGFLGLLLLRTLIFAFVSFFAAVACWGVAVVPDWRW